MLSLFKQNMFESIVVCHKKRKKKASFSLPCFLIQLFYFCSFVCLSFQPFLRLLPKHLLYIQYLLLLILILTSLFILFLCFILSFSSLHVFLYFHPSLIVFFLFPVFFLLSRIPLPAFVLYPQPLFFFLIPLSFFFHSYSRLSLLIAFFTSSFLFNPLLLHLIIPPYSSFSLSLPILSVSFPPSLLLSLRLSLSSYLTACSCTLLKRSELLLSYQRMFISILGM